MRSAKLIAGIAAASIAFTPAANAAIGMPFGVVVPHAGPHGGTLALPICVVSIMLAAAHKGERWKRELTTEEAITCGLLYWINSNNRPR